MLSGEMSGTLGGSADAQVPTRVAESKISRIVLGGRRTTPQRRGARGVRLAGERFSRLQLLAQATPNLTRMR
jgi:hypothetical protein